MHVIAVASRNLWLRLETTSSLVEISRLRVAINAYRIRLRVVTTAAKSEPLVASRNLWLRVVTKTWWTETSVASRNLGCESQPPLSRLGYFVVFGLWLLGFLLTGLCVVATDCVFRADPITQLFVVVCMLSVYNMFAIRVRYVLICTQLDPYLVTMLGRGDQHTWPGKISTEQPKVSSQLKSMRPGGLGHETKTTLSPCKGDTIYIPSLVTGNKLIFPSLVIGKPFG